MKGLKLIQREKISLIYASGQPWPSLLIGVLLKKIAGIPLVIDFQNPRTDNPCDKLNHPIRRELNRFLERKVVKSSDFIVVDTEALRHVIVEKYPELSPRRFVTITNGYDESDFAGLGSPEKSMGLIT